MKVLWQTHVVAQLLLDGLLLFFDEFIQTALKERDVPIVRKIVTNLSEVVKLNKQILAKPTESECHLQPLGKPRKRPESRKESASSTRNSLRDFPLKHVS